MDLDSLVSLLIAAMSPTGAVAIGLALGVAILVRLAGWANPDRLVIGVALFIGTVGAALGLTALEGEALPPMVGKALAAGLLAPFAWFRLVVPSIAGLKGSRRRRKRNRATSKGTAAVP